MPKRFAVLALMCSIVASPLSAEGVEVALHHIVSIPMGDEDYGAGRFELPLNRGFATSAEWFRSEGLSVRAAASFLNPAAILYPASGDPADVDLGTLGLDVYSLTVRWHLAPERRVHGFAGIGGAFVSPGDLDDRFGEAIEAEVGSETTFVAEVGIRYRHRPRLTLELGATWMPLEATVDVRRSTDPRVQLPATLSLDSVTVNAGAGWRF